MNTAEIFRGGVVKGHLGGASYVGKPKSEGLEKPREGKEALWWARPSRVDLFLQP